MLQGLLRLLSAASLGLAPTPVALFTSEVCLKHEPGWFNPERPERLSSLLEAMRAEWASEFAGQVPPPHRAARTLVVPHTSCLATHPVPCHTAEHPRAGGRCDARATAAGAHARTPRAARRRLRTRRRLPHSAGQPRRRHRREPWDAGRRTPRRRARRCSGGRGIAIPY